ncbi:MAG: CBS domain-containing protein, partial [Candidatus Micrarchaeota archaeon]|nr:CBS domain-containing protein [Candidatus Micrarchaeota archaeon]
MEFEDAVVMDANEPVSSAIGKIIKGEPCVIVTKNGEYLGVFSDINVNEVIDTSKEKLGTVCERAPLLSEGADTREAVQTFLDGRYKALPIKTKEGWKIIRRNKFLKHLLKQNLLPNVKLGEIMTVPVYTVDHKENVGKAKEIMRKNHVRRVVVTEGGKLAGIVAMRDLLVIAESKKDRPPFVKDKVSSDRQPIRDYMNTEVHTLSPTSLVSDAVQLLQDTDASSVVIAEGTRPIGIVSVRDLFEIVAAKKEEERIYLSGLDRADEEYLPEIRSTVEKVMEKIENFARIEYIAIHYKKLRYKGLRSRHEVKVRAKGDRTISVSNADWDIRTATQGAMQELLTVIKKSHTKV